MESSNDFKRRTLIDITRNVGYTHGTHHYPKDPVSILADILELYSKEEIQLASTLHRSLKEFILDEKDHIWNGLD